MATRDRPDPDALLAAIQADAEAAERTRGRLKVFFGATAGVGKTFAMLEAAQERRRAGTDVVVGYVETHGRRETEALLDGLAVLSRKLIRHRGVALTEFDLDAALARHPQILLVDELAHTNAPGSRHEKRWQDVDELLAAGVDVYTTLNVQHIESLNDVVTRITGVHVRETVPDSVLEAADEVELIDLPPEELLRRLEEGKVYMPEQAERAMERFFRKGNLIALRQLALLHTADRVDRQMELYRRAHAAAESWPIRERLLVGVGPAPSSERLVRATKRMADRLGAEWTAVFVQTPAYEHWSQADRDRVWETLRLAESLGARTITLSGGHAASEILSYARSHNVTKIVVGKPTHARWRDLVGLSFHDEIVRGSGDIDVYVITGEEEGQGTGPAARLVRRAADWHGAAWTVLAVALSTAVAALMYRHFERTNLVMVYLVAVLLVAVRFGRREAVLASVLSVAAFDFFFVPPRFTFAVADTQYLVTFAVMLLVAIVTGTLTARFRQQSVTAREREWRTAFLYGISRDLMQVMDVDAMLSLAVPRVATAFGSEVEVLLSGPAGDLQLSRGGGGPPGGATSALPPSELPPIQWANTFRRAAGLGTGTFSDMPVLYLPLVASKRSLGVVRIRPTDPDRMRAPEQLHLLEAAVNQIAAAMERVRLAEEASRIRELEEMDRLKSEFVAVASHELNVPLRGLASSLDALRARSTAPDWSDADRRTLEAAEGDTRRLCALVDDLLDLSRLEAGRLQLAIEAAPAAGLVEHAVRMLRARAQARGVELAVDLSDGLPDVAADVDRVEGVFDTLITNALSRTSPGGHILISADPIGRFVQFSVTDDGVGIPVEEQSRVFDKFVHLTSGDQANGTGLGLAIAREVARTHRGAMWVDSGPGPGSVFSFTLPVANAAAPRT